MDSILEVEIQDSGEQRLPERKTSWADRKTPVLTSATPVSSCASPMVKLASMGRGKQEVKNPLEKVGAGPGTPVSSCASPMVKLASMGTSMKEVKNPLEKLGVGPATPGTSYASPVMKMASMGTSMMELKNPLEKLVGPPDAQRIGRRPRGSSELSWFEDNQAMSRTLSETSALSHGPESAEGATPRRYMTLSDGSRLARACCCIPGTVLFSMILVQVFMIHVWEDMFFAATGVISCLVFGWTFTWSMSAIIGVWKMRRAAAIDWHAKVLEAQEELKKQDKPHEVMHIVIVPNYKEEEDMLEETLVNIARSPLARETIRVVLGVEEREGPPGVAKAERLIGKTSHLFADIFAVYHPGDRRNELAGKSSNTQWAYRKAVQRYKDLLSKFDPTKVVVSVTDADTIWNPQYFTALTYEALTRPAEDIAWTIWQPPMMLFRNIFAVPMLNRLTGFGTLLFELSGLVTSGFMPHFCFSSYSVSFALTSNRQVKGWDADVIAEDHHMFVKCFFAALWDAVDADSEKKAGKEGRAGDALVAQSKVKLQPIFLPAEGYLVEASGYVSTLIAKFVQARRHCQGVTEISYTFLQYVRILRRTSLTWSTHREIFVILAKMFQIHIMNQVQTLSLTVSCVYMAVRVASPFLTGGLLSGLGALWEHGYLKMTAGLDNATSLSQFGVFFTFVPSSPIMASASIANFIVLKDVIEGRYVRPPTATGDAVPEEDCLSRWDFAMLALNICGTFVLAGWPTIFIFGTLPAVMASWSLLTRGTYFEYIVAEKPGDGNPGSSSPGSDK